jgi:hypothetical protein
MDASLERMCAVFNFLEAILWLSIAAGFAVVFCRRRKNPRLMLAAGLLFFAFGISDFVEIHTGAWYKPWWLFAWKAACVVGFPIVFGLFWRQWLAASKMRPPDQPCPSSSTADAMEYNEANPTSSHGPATAMLRLPVPGWVALVWRSAWVAVLATACLFLCIPVARVKEDTCRQIQAGMTVAQASQIVGAPPGWYDGVRQIRTDAPLGRGDKPYWVGSRGEIILNVDTRGHVVKAAFYSGQVIERPPLDFVVERLLLRWFRWQ